MTGDLPRVTGGGHSLEAHQDAPDRPLHAKSDQSDLESLSDPLAPIPDALRTTIRLYLRAGEVTKAREICERYGADWAAVHEALRRAA